MALLLQTNIKVQFDKAVTRLSKPYSRLLSPSNLVAFSECFFSASLPNTKHAGFNGTSNLCWFIYLGSLSKNNGSPPGQLSAIYRFLFANASENYKMPDWNLHNPKQSPSPGAVGESAYCAHYSELEYVDRD
jgi:hypothetical protein